MKKPKELYLKDYIKISVWSFKVNWNISPFFTITSVITTIYYKLLPLANTYIIARIVDNLIDVVARGQGNISEIIPLILIIAIFDLVSALFNALSTYTNRCKWKFANAYLSEMKILKMNELGVQTLQLPEVENKIQIIDNWLDEITEVHRNIIDILASVFQTIVVGIIFIQFSWWLTLLIIIGSLISFFKEKYFFKKDWELHTSEKIIDLKKQANWSRFYLATTESLEEVSVIGAFDYLKKKFRNYYDFFNKSFEKIIRQSMFYDMVIEIYSVIVLVIASIHVFLSAINGIITIGSTTFYIALVKNFYQAVSGTLLQFVYLRDRVIKQKDVYDFFNMKSQVEDGHIELERLIEPPRIEFKNVSFRYPNSKRYVIKDLSFKISSGEKIAMVGENGAGKSTIIRLICRMYDPQKGEILINGINIKDLKINDWYKNIGALFQEFNFYRNLSAEENIYIGRSAKPKNEKKIFEASKNADAHDFIKKYEYGYKTIMHPIFIGGIKPSKGQQQKIAIARFFYRDAPLAIFDEPTSAIDADAEFRIFNRIYNFFDKKTVMIISHRFSTVRKADRIFVIKDGSIVEEGKHKELMSLNGIYASNFNKQAQGYSSE